MSKPAKGRVSPGFKIGLALVGLLLAALILRNAVVVIGNDLGAPIGLSERIWPPDAQLEQVDALLITSEIDWTSRSPAEVTAAARRARSLDPLDEWPFALQGLVETRNGNLAAAEKLFTEAHQRNLRSPLPHLLLLMADARSGDADTTLQRLVRFMTRWPQQSEALMPIIKQVFEQNERGALIAGLDRNPALRARIIENFSRMEGGEAIVMELLARPGVPREQKIDSAQQFGMRERHALGYPLFRAIAGENFSVPFDPEFRGLAGPQPYVWTIVSNSEVTADFSRQNPGDAVALDVEFFGANLVDVATQVMRIAPGRHTLTVNAAPVESEGGSASLRWLVACEGSKAELARLAFQNLAKPGTARVDFAVPGQGCEYQRITLMAVPSDDTGQTRVRFTRIAIAPAGVRP